MLQPVTAFKYPAFSADTVIRDHKVFHNQDLMTLIGPYLLATTADRVSFVMTCRFWRYVYYTKLAEKSGKLSPRKQLFASLSVDACRLLLAPLNIISIRDIDSVMSVTVALQDHRDFLQHLHPKMWSAAVRIFAAAIFDDVTVFEAAFKPRVAEYSDGAYTMNGVSRLLGIDGVPPETVSLLLSYLTHQERCRIFTIIVPVFKVKAAKLFPYLKVELGVFTEFMHHTTIIDENDESAFAELCRALASNVTPREYATCLRSRNFPYDKKSCCDSYLLSGSSLNGFAAALFSYGKPHGSHIYITMVNRFIQLGLIEPCTTTKFHVAFSRLPRMTIFQYAHCEGGAELCEFIRQRPEFNLGDHLDFVALSVKRKAAITLAFLEVYTFSYMQLILMEDMLNAVEAKSRKHDKSSFYEVRRVLEAKLSEFRPVKRIKVANE